MGTKNNPGKFDCYANAEPDEPMFVLLGRDKHAPALVALWAVLRELDGEQPGKVFEAQQCANAMARYHRELKGESPVAPDLVAVAAIAEMRRVNAGEVSVVPAMRSVTEEMHAIWPFRDEAEPE